MFYVWCSGSLNQLKASCFTLLWTASREYEELSKKWQAETTQVTTRVLPPSAFPSATSTFFLEKRG